MGRQRDRDSRVVSQEKTESTSRAQTGSGSQGEEITLEIMVSSPLSDTERRNLLLRNPVWETLKTQMMHVPKPRQLKIKALKYFKGLV